jgi:esterase
VSRRSICAAVISACMFVCSVQAAPKWQLPTGVKTIEVNGYDMAYQETGSGVPIVLVHGALNDYRVWHEQVPEFSKQFRVISMSLRHHYPEKWDGQGDDYSIEQHIADVGSFIIKMNLGKVHLLGHSRGGAVVLSVAKEHPEVIKTLILEDASGMEALLPEAPESQELARQTRDNRDALARNLASGNIELAVEVYLDSFSVPGTFAKMPPERKQGFLDNIGTVLKSEGQPVTTCEQIGKFEFPVLLLTGERSPKRYAEMFGAMRRCKNIAAQIVIPNAGHPMHLDNSTVFNDAVLDFLARN